MNTCTYLGPEYDPLDAGQRLKPTPYCGCATLPGKSYCAEHYAIVYAKGSALRKRHKDLRKVKYIQDLQQMILDIAEELEDEGWTPEQDLMLEGDR